jgi:hypothetical protein
MNTTPRPWYKKKRYYVLIGLISLITVASVESGQNNIPPSVQGVSYNAQPTTQGTINQVSAPEVQKIPSHGYVPVDAGNDGLSNDNQYTNTEGNTVHSPAYNTEDSSVPSGASAQCRDGTYSFSQSRRGTCSHHGGVSSWF